MICPLDLVNRTPKRQLSTALSAPEKNTTLQMGGKELHSTPLAADHSPDKDGLDSSVGRAAD